MVKWTFLFVLLFSERRERGLASLAAGLFDVVAERAPIYAHFKVLIIGLYKLFLLIFYYFPWSIEKPLGK